MLKSFYSLGKRTMMSRGSIIVFEGCDRCGKTTQCKKLVEYLNENNKPTKLQRFPDRTTAIGSVCNDYLANKCELEDHAVHLMFTANRWEAVPKMMEVINSGTSLIIDRYSYSGVAFTSAKKGLELEWCKNPERGLPKPDLVLYLSLSAEEAAKRGSYGEERYDETNFQKRVAANYDTLREPSWVVVDANKTIEALHEELRNIVVPIIESDKPPVGKLWTES